MDSIIENNFSKAFAIAWSENQGSYSHNLAKKVLNFIKLQGLKVSSVLDICCGSANFLEEMEKNGLNCTGTEILDSYVEYNKSKYPNIKFFKTETVDGIDSLEKYDLITCNHDVINMLPTLDEWEKFFKKVYTHLNNGGIFIFDYYTKRKLQNWNETTFDGNEKLDYIKNVVSSQNKTSISSIYYINLITTTKDTNVSAVDRQYSLNNYDSKYKKTDDTMVEYYFENQDILTKLKSSGYRYLITADGKLSPTSTIEDLDRMHIIAIKREQ